MTPHTPPAQHPKECDGDCLSCDVDTYITCEKRINPLKTPGRSPFDKLIKWKHDYISQHGYYPNVNDIWNEVDKIREADTRSRPRPAPAQERYSKDTLEMVKSMSYAEGARQAREDILKELEEWNPMRSGHHFVIYQEDFKKKLESLRGQDHD